MTTGISISRDRVRAEIAPFSTSVYVFLSHNDSEPTPDFWDIVDLWIKRGLRHAEEGEQ